MFLAILKEIELYLKSYEEGSEDSDWDSDEEIATVQLAKDLKKAIQEKSNITNELSEVEKNLLTANSNYNTDESSRGKDGNASQEKDRKDSLTKSFGCAHNDSASKDCTPKDSDTCKI